MKSEWPHAGEERSKGLGPEQRGGVVTLLFTDVAGSTALKERLGDRAGVALVQEHHTLVRKLLEQFPAAEEISTAGDSFLLTFIKPSDGVRFALLLQSRLGQLDQGRAVPVQDRMGLHLGEVLIEERQGKRDVHGMQVDACARVMGLAQPGQILMTRPVFDNARQSLKGEEIEGVSALEWLNHGRFELKGVGEPVEVCEVRAAEAAKLSPPATSEKARRVEAAEGEAVLGWRPAVGSPVPNTQWLLEQKLGEGGFGEVWLGRHQVMKERRVFKFCFRADRVRSLKREMTLFRLIKERIGDHPNIVSLREVFFDQPPYYVEMDYAEGSDLASWCEAQGGPEKVPLETKLEIVAQVADALQAAHDAGVIHRDVKPANVLVGNPKSEIRNPKEGQIPKTEIKPSSFVTCHSSLQAKLTDFGIGQVVSEEALAGVTRAGFTQTILSSSSSQTGTQLYMAPELLAGSPACTRSDIYSLGVVLYQFLVGDFHRPLVTDWAKDILDPLLRDDLQHCFMGNPEQRFVGAGQLARNLRAWRERTAKLEREEAERAERERLRIQTERRRRMLVAGGAIGLVLAALAAALGYGLREARREREQQRRLAYASDVKAAQVAVQENNRGLAVSLLRRHVPEPGQTDLRGVEWRYLWREVNGSESHSFPHLLSLTDVAFSPDGRVLATAAFDKLIQLWDIASEKQVREFQGGGSYPQKRCLGFTPDGKRFVFRGRQGVEVHETSGWELLTNLHCAGNSPLVLSRNGKRLVFQTDTEMQAWELETWECQRLPGRGTFCYGLAVSADGTLAALSQASLAWQGAVFIWDIPGNTCVPLVDKSDVVSFAFSPDGKWLASGHCSGQVALWDVRTRRPVRSWHAHQGFVYGLAFSPDSTRLASGGNDQVIILWESGTTNRLGQLSGHWGEIECLAFSADGRRIASGSSDTTAKIWDLQMGQSADDTKGLTLPTNALPICPSADGAGLFTLDEKENAVSLWSCQSGQLLWSCSRNTLQPDDGGNLAYFLKPRLAVGFGANRVLRIWDMTSRKQWRSVPLPVSSLKPACLSPNQRWLVADTGNLVRLFDLNAGRLVSDFGFQYQFYFTADFSPDGRLLAVSTLPTTNRGDNDIHVWDLNAGKERLRCAGSTYCSTALRFSPDSRLLASADYIGDVQLWSAETGKPLGPALKGHQSIVETCSFSADGKTLITSGLDFTLRFWSAAAGQEVLWFHQALSISADRIGSLDMLYRAQAEVNPVPDALIWQDLGRGTRLTSLPTLPDIDRVIAHRQERLAEETRRSEARKAAIARDPGAIKKWLILGPIPLAPGQTEVEGLDAELVNNEARLHPRAGERLRTPGGDLAWRSVRLTDYAIDFNELLGPAERAAVYAAAYVSMPASRSNLSLLVGSDDQAKVYLNGQQVYRQTEGRGLDPDEDRVSGIELKAGINVLVFKVINVAAGWGGSIRIADAAGDLVPGITVLDSPP